MCPEELVLFISTLAITIAKDKSTDEINLLSVIFSQLGDTLATIATSRDIHENKESNESSNCCDSPDKDNSQDYCNSSDICDTSDLCD